MYIIKLLGLLLFTALLFIGRFGASAVASDQIVISPITDQPVSRLIVQESPAPLRLRKLSPQAWSIQPINHLEILTEAQPIPQNLAQLQQADLSKQASHQTCATLQTAVAERFGQGVTKTETAFADVALGMAGLDCQLTVVRSSDDPEDYLTIAQELKTSLEAAGWREDETYVAYGPNEITLALLQADNSGMLTVARQALNPTACRGSRAPAICQTEANQQRYHITFSFTVAPLPDKKDITIIHGANEYNE